MKKAWRFLFGCALGLGIGYAVTLLLSPGPPTRTGRERRAPDDASES